jgi:hypothetical protein
MDIKEGKHSKGGINDTPKHPRPNPPSVQDKQKKIDKLFDSWIIEYCTDNDARGYAFPITRKSYYAGYNEGYDAAKKAIPPAYIKPHVNHTFSNLNCPYLSVSKMFGVTKCGVTDSKCSPVPACALIIPKRPVEEQDLTQANNSTDIFNAHFIDKLPKVSGKKVLNMLNEYLCSQSYVSGYSSGRILREFSDYLKRNL